MQLGWIGLGHMGVPMAKRLIDGGHDLLVYNRTYEKTAPLTELGATAVREVQDVVRQSDILFVMLATDLPSHPFSKVSKRTSPVRRSLT